MKLEWLRYFSEAVKYNSITIAAEKNYLSKPSLSAGISKLERELGVELLRRTNQGVTPTEAGEVVLEKTDAIFALIESMRQELNCENTVGSVKILSITMFYSYVIPSIILKAKKEGKPYLIEANTAETEQIISSVSSGLADFGIIWYDADALGSSVTYKPLFKEKCVLIVGPHSPYWDASSITLEEALREPYIAYRGEFQQVDRAIWTRALGPGMRPNISFRTDDMNMLKRMIVQSDYVAFFPEIMSQEEDFLCSGILRAIPLEGPQLPLEVGYIYGNYNKLSGFCKHFIDVMEQSVQEYLTTGCIK